MAFLLRVPLPVPSGISKCTLAREILAMSQEEFSRAFSKSPMKRAKLRGLKRNAAVVLGNVGAEADVPALMSALLDAEPLVRSHSAWALGRIGSAAAIAALRERVDTEEETSVRVELLSAFADDPRTS